MSKNEPIQSKVPAFPFNIEIQRRPGLDINGKALIRHAVRAIVNNNGKLLMVYSTVLGDYKFPGGGMKAGEQHKQTLQRELLEETGFSLRSIIGQAGVILEYDRVREKDYDLFKMYSYYYLCTIKNKALVPDLEPYEKRLGFTRTWIDCKVALKNNEKLLVVDNGKHPGWLKRETSVLRILKDMIG